MVLLSLLFAAGAAALPASNLVLHEKRSSSRLEGRSQRLDPKAILPIRIALTESNLDYGYEHLMSVSDPQSANYGKHWTIEEIHDYFAPSDEAAAAVKAWLESVGVARDDILESTSRSWVGVDMPAADAERLFGTEYWEHHDEDGDYDVGCDKYHVPSHLSHHIDYIKPGIMRSPFVKRSAHLRNYARPEARGLKPYGPSNTSELATCGRAITPACLKALYDIPDATLNQEENTLGVYEDYYDVYDQRDLNLYFEAYAPYVPRNTKPKLVAIGNVDVPETVKNGGGESVVDFDLVFALTYPQSVILYQTKPTKQEAIAWSKNVPGSKDNKASAVSSRSLFEVLLDAVDGSFCSKTDKAAGAECGTVDLTTVLSVSYAASELFLPEPLTKRACNAYMKLGLKGHTLLFASGDQGPAANTGCVNPKHVDNPTAYNGTVFNPYFPASCPFVTAVGATQLENRETVDDPETALYQPALAQGLPYYTFGSGGGFSNYFSVPGYQKSVVNTYLDEHDPGYPTYKYTGKDSVGAGGGKYALGGRGIPDVSANGAKLAGFLNGQDSGGNFGTSLATPIWASLITLINQQRTLAGKGPVGFINPVLYANADIFTDITSGFVPGCLTRGYSCVEGWDPVTGLGTPNYPKLLKVFMDLP